MGVPGSAPDVTREDVWNVFRQLDQPSTPVTAAEVAEKLECTQQVAKQNLEELTERGELQTKQLDSTTRVWWRSETTADQQVAEFRSFVSAVKDYAIFMLNPDGTVASWNEGAKRIKGYEEDEIVGKHFSTFYTDEAIADGAPETNLETAIAEGRVEDEGWRVREDGTLFWANVTITAVRDDDGTLLGFTKVTHDVTERREYEQELRHERDLTEQILETAPASIGVLNAEGQFIRANQRILDRHGIEEADLPQYSITSLEVYTVGEDPIPIDDWPWRRAIEDKETVHDFQCQVDLPNVGHRWLSINAAPLDYDPTQGKRAVVAIDDITEQKEREQQLRRESEQTEKLLRTAPVGIAVQNTDRETVMANRRAQESFGLSEEEFINNPVDTGEWEIYDTNGDPIEPTETPSARVLATGEPAFDEELIFESPNGDRMYIRVNAAPVFGPDGEIDRIITGGKDITELKERKRQLEQHKTELETELGEIFDRISDAFYALDDEWRFTHINEHALEPLQQSKEELLGQKVWDVIPDASTDIYREKYHKALETQEPVNFEVYEEDFDAWFEYNLYPSDTGLSIYFHDITQRKEYQHQLEESNERLEQFAYAASHDLQEPLRMITSYLQLLENRYADSLDEDAREFIEFAVDGADRMRDMIDGLLEYSRVETRGDPFESVDLDEVLENTIENLQVRIAETNADITTESLPQVHGDESQLQQVFQNLVDNAIEYRGDNPPQVTISAERKGAKWTISVHDNGIGIDPEDSDRIFRVFERLHSQEEYSGTGIGLALCQRIVERHNGEIWVDSEPGEGTTFSFTLPAV